MQDILPNLNKNIKTNNRIELILHELYEKAWVEDEKLMYLLDNITVKDLELLQYYANKKRNEMYGNRVFLRGLIEFSNICKQNCMYCGLRKGNLKVSRYRMKKDEIMDIVSKGIKLGYKTFVFQSGEDEYYTDEVLVEIIKSIREMSHDCAITLSIGERSRDSYQSLFNAGANRFLLRHETASKSLYQSLHPLMSFENRMECLKNLKEIGYQVGAGFMVGLPRQTNEDLLKDLKFLKDFNPHMCGIGPYISHNDTPLRGNVSGTVNQTLVLLGLTRLLLPKVLLPATTALGTIDKCGKEKALRGGANVLMPNLTPMRYKEKYQLYQRHIEGDEVKSNVNDVVDLSRGDYLDFYKTEKET